MGHKKLPHTKMTDFKFSEEFIQNALNNFFSYSSVKYNVDGLYVFDWESDKLLETKSGYIYEFEIKISRADFKNDFKHKKDKHIILEGGEKYGDKYLPKYYELLEESRKVGTVSEKYFLQYASKNDKYMVEGHKKPNYFYYAVPTDLITVDEVPEYAGLVYVDEKQNLTIKKSAPKLHKEKYKDSDLNLGEKFYYNMESWKNKCKKAWNDKDFWKEKLEKELEDKCQSRAYQDLENELEGYKKAYHELSQREQKAKEELHRDLYRQNRMVTLLARELQKYNPEFNLFAFEDEHFEQ